MSGSGYLRAVCAWQVKPFRKLRKVHNQGKRTRVRDLIRYDLRQMHAAFTGTLPVGSSSEPLNQVQVSNVLQSATANLHILRTGSNINRACQAGCLCHRHILLPQGLRALSCIVG